VGGGPDADAVGEGPTRRAAADRGSPDGGDAAAPNPSGVRADGRAEAVRFESSGRGNKPFGLSVPAERVGLSAQPESAQPGLLGHPNRAEIGEDIQIFMHAYMQTCKPLLYPRKQLQVVRIAGRFFLN
jgi:hypothetical protein